MVKAYDESPDMSHDARVSSGLRGGKEWILTEEEIAERKKQLEDCYELLLEHRNFLHGSRCFRYFSSILSNFKAAGNTPSLSTNCISTWTHGRRR